MLLELGPLASPDVQLWARFARRIICEVRVDPDDLDGVVSADLLDEWQRLIDTWDRAASTGSDDFRWSAPIDAELAEYLLHGLERCLHSSLVQERATLTERCIHAPFTFHVLQGFLDGLAAEGHVHEQYVDQVRGSVGQRLDH
jgi:hypothetical protein